MSEAVAVSYRDGVALATIDRPPVNAVDQVVRAGLEHAFAELRARKDVEAIVVGCAGRTFVAGADIKEFDTGIAPPAYHDVFRLIEDSPVPVVAAIHGTALGAGTELTLACHYRIAEENARLGLPELSLGIIPGAGGTQRMPRLIGPARAKDLIYSGRFVAAGEALAIGLVDRVVPDDQVYQAAVEEARRYAAGPLQALRAAKVAITWGSRTDLRSGLVIERETFADLCATRDQKEGMQAFAEKRKPEFTGR